MKKTKIFPVKLIHSKPLVNDHLLQSTTITFLYDGGRIFPLFYLHVSDHFRHSLISMFAVCTTLLRV